MPIIVSPAAPAGLGATGLPEVVLDPSEVASNRTELDLNSGTIKVAEPGVDWGDAAIAAYMSEQSLGEIPVDFRTPNRQVKIPLILHEDDFEGARAQLLAKVALFQREGGWLRRGDGLYADIVNASLTFPDHYAPAFGFETDVVLSLEAIPDFYGNETDLGTFTETSNPELIHVFNDLEGDHPGRCRIVVTDASGNDQLGVIWGIRSRHYDSDATAHLAYEAEALTPLDVAFVSTATIPGTASGGGSNNVMAHGSLSTGWTPVLSTDLVGVGALTHKGTYRVYGRVYSTWGSLVQARLVWDVGDLALPVENPPVRMPGLNLYYDIDFGEIRLDPSPVGTHRWQGVIQAKGDNGGEAFCVDRLWLVPVDEGDGKLVAPVSADQGLAPLVARDEFKQSIGDLTGKTAQIGGAWSGGGDADYIAVSGGEAVRIAVGDTAPRLQWLATGLTTQAVESYAFCEQVGILGSASATQTGPDMWGIAARVVNATNYLALFHRTTITSRELVIGKMISGTLTELANIPLSGTDVQSLVYYPLRLAVYANGRWAAWRGVASGGGGNPRSPAPPRLVAQGYDAALATGGTLASGGCGLVDYVSSSSPGTFSRKWDNFAAWVPPSDAVLFANQSAELRSNGMVREDAAGAAYGPVSQVTGDLPRLPPAGLEGRSTELFVKASRGDLDQLPDQNIDDIQVQVFHRPSFLFPTGT